jgi:plasmid stabilization system protein ParE
MKIKWSDESLPDLESLHTYIAKDDSRAAQKMVLTIIAAVENNLINNPHIGRPGRVN